MPAVGMALQSVPRIVADVGDASPCTGLWLKSYGFNRTAALHHELDHDALSNAVGLAERTTRRHAARLAASRLPPGKRLDSFDFRLVPSVSRAAVETLLEMSQGEAAQALGIPPGTMGRRYQRAPQLRIRDRRHGTRSAPTRKPCGEGCESHSSNWALQRAPFGHCHDDLD